jgi:hypothetical protein
MLPARPSGHARSRGAGDGRGVAVGVAAGRDGDGDAVAVAGPGVDEPLQALNTKARPKIVVAITGKETE